MPFNKKEREKQTQEANRQGTLLQGSLKFQASE